MDDYQWIISNWLLMDTNGTIGVDDDLCLIGTK